MIEKMEIVPFKLSILLSLICPSSAQNSQFTTYIQQFIEEITTMIFPPSALFSLSPATSDFRRRNQQVQRHYLLRLECREWYDELPPSPTVLTIQLQRVYVLRLFDRYPIRATKAKDRSSELPSRASAPWPSSANLTINCLSITPAQTAVCTTTSLNLDQVGFPSYTTLAESSTYPAIFLQSQMQRLLRPASPPPSRSVPVSVCLSGSAYASSSASWSTGTASTSSPPAWDVRLLWDRSRSLVRRRMRRWSRTETGEVVGLGRIVMMERMVLGEIMAFGGVRSRRSPNESDGSWWKAGNVIPMRPRFWNRLQL